MLYILSASCEFLYKNTIALSTKPTFYVENSLMFGGKKKSYFLSAILMKDIKWFLSLHPLTRRLYVQALQQTP